MSTEGQRSSSAELAERLFEAHADVLDDEMPDDYLALIRRVIDVMVEATDGGYSFAQVLVEAEHVVLEGNGQADESRRRYEGDWCGGESFERASGSEYSWVVSPRTVRTWNRGDRRLATVSDADLAGAIRHWMSRDIVPTESFDDLFDTIISSASDGAEPPPSPED